MADIEKNKIRKLKLKFKNMHCRCEYKRDISYPRYGGRGITVCSRWNCFNNFYKDMSPNYKDGLTLDRIDNNGNYCKKNCRWTTKAEQARNTRNVERANQFTFKGVTKTIREWAEDFKIKRKTLSMRLLGYGWSIERSLIEEVHSGR